MILRIATCSRIKASTREKTLIGPIRVLESIEFYRQQPIPLGDNRFTLRLKRTSFGLGPKEGRYLEGRADYNYYHGKYIFEEDNGSLSILFLFHTDLNCGGGSLDGLYYKALSLARKYKITEQTLTMTLDEEGGTLVFKAE